MHWFWRAAIAVGAAYGLCWGWNWFVVVPLALRQIERGYDPSSIWAFNNVSWLVQLATAVGIYGLLTRRYYESRPTGETRCRRCGYILRGISEPRCPECGERI